MTELDGRVATLAAVFAPANAPAWLARLGTPGVTEAIAQARRLASAPRHERLRALAAALAPHRHGVRSSAEAIASLERRRVADVVRTLAAGSVGEAISPVIVRLCRERIAR